MRAFLAAAAALCAGFPAAAQIFDNPLPPVSRPQAVPVPQAPAADEADPAPQPDGIVVERDESGSITLTAAGASRREVLEQLGYGDAAEWRDQDFAGQPVTGRFSGDAGAIVRRVLERGNFLIVYADDGGTQRISRIVIYGARPLASAPADVPVTASARPAAARPRQQTPAEAMAKKDQQRRGAEDVRRRLQRAPQ
jgi:hypothetical protein